MHASLPTKRKVANDGLDERRKKKKEEEERGEISKDRKQGRERRESRKQRGHFLKRKKCPLMLKKFYI